MVVALCVWRVIRGLLSFPTRRSSDLKDSLRYRAGKFARRNPLVVGAVSLSVLILIGGISATAYQARTRSEEHTSVLQSPCNLVCRLLLEEKKYADKTNTQQNKAYETM